MARSVRHRLFSLVTLLGLFAGLLVLVAPAASATRAESLSASGTHTCVVTAAGGVMCWGNNQFGQLGDGTTVDRYAPVQVEGLTSGVSAVSVGDEQTCALTDAGDVKCWGRNLYGEVGDGTTQVRLTPTAVKGLARGAIEVSAGLMFTCAVTTDGAVKCWGRNEEGQLGNGTTVNSAVPIRVHGLATEFSGVSVGGYHACALSGVGSLMCWGENNYGQLGNGTTNSASTPVAVTPIPGGVSSVSAGIWDTCAVANTNQPWCWGSNEEGQLGIGTQDNQPYPTQVIGLSHGVTSIDAATDHTCAVDTGGGAWCWGYNYSGMLGTGGGASHEANPVSVFGLNAGVAAVEAGWEYSCALTVNEGVKCWGSDSWGVLGHGITPAWSRPIPTAVWGMTGNATESYRPDVEVKRVGGFYIGNDTYTTDATGQTLTTRLVQGEHKEFLFRFSNDSNVDDTVFLGDWNTGGSLKYRWRFFLGTTEIGLRTGSYWTVLAPGESLTIRLRIYKRLSAPDIKLAGVWVGIYSSNDSARYDLARVQVVA